MLASNRYTIPLKVQTQNTVTEVEKQPKTAASDKLQHHNRNLTPSMTEASTSAYRKALRKGASSKSTLPSSKVTEKKVKRGSLCLFETDNQL